jgi:RimJ/RimL family protein N-acetyltransferase
MSSIPARLVTERLLLRCWEPEDAPALREAIDGSLDLLRQWLPWAMGEPSPVEEVAERLSRFRETFRAGKDWAFAVLDLGTGSVLGGAGLHRREGPGALEIGYWLRREALGHGYTTEAVEALARAALEHGGVERVEIRCDPANVGSIEVARRTGFRHVVTLVRNARTPAGEPRDTMVWERTR